MARFAGVTRLIRSCERQGPSPSRTSESFLLSYSNLGLWFRLSAAGLAASIHAVRPSTLSSSSRLASLRVRRPTTTGPLGPALVGHACFAACALPLCAGIPPCRTGNDSRTVSHSRSLSPTPRCSVRSPKSSTSGGLPLLRSPGAPCLFPIPVVASCFAAGWVAYLTHKSFHIGTKIASGKQSVIHA